MAPSHHPRGLATGLRAEGCAYSSWQPVFLFRGDNIGKLRVHLEAFSKFNRICLSRPHMIANLPADCFVMCKA